MLRFTLFFLLLAGSGCAPLGELKTTSILRLKSAGAWRVSYDMPEDPGNYRHFAKGWKQGYFDVSDGREGVTPAVPPRRYWAYRFKTEEGRRSVAAWYEGYELGVYAAKQACEQQLNFVPSDAEFLESPDGAYDTYSIMNPFSAADEQGMSLENDDEIRQPVPTSADMPPPPDEGKPLPLPQESVKVSGFSEKMPVDGFRVEQAPK